MRLPAGWKLVERVDGFQIELPGKGSPLLSVKGDPDHGLGGTLVWKRKGRIEGIRWHSLPDGSGAVLHPFKLPPGGAR